MSYFFSSSVQEQLDFRSLWINRRRERKPQETSVGAIICHPAERRGTGTRKKSAKLWESKGMVLSKSSQVHLSLQFAPQAAAGQEQKKVEPRVLFQGHSTYHITRDTY